MAKNHNKRFVFTIPFYLKDELVKISKEKSCSQAEIIKLALIKYFREVQK